MPFCPHHALRCPMDGSPLVMQSSCLVCAHRHSFDVARQGYVNLLGVQDKRSSDPGDSKAMIAARHRFLEAGYYQPIADRLAALVIPRLKPASLIVDAGCGDGYYLQQLREQLHGSGEAGREFVGFDISKWAMQTAARRFPATWLVASNRNIPVAAESTDLVIEMFGFPDFDAFARVLKPAGLLLRVQAGDGHLLALRETIYPEIKSTFKARAEPPGFCQIDSVQVRFEITSLMQPVLGDLLLMTPHFFRASQQAKARVAVLPELTVDVDVSLDLFQKN